MVEEKKIKDELKRLLKPIEKGYGKYAFLHVFLSIMPEEQKQLSFSLQELSRIMRDDLPNSAFNHRAWWSNTKSNSHAAAWLDAGWEVAEVFLPSQIIVFNRKGSRPVRNIPDYVNTLLNNRHIKRYPNSQTLSQWIRFCKQVGWYFEGVVLYEKGGLRTDVLNETERLEIEEDYRICKKKMNEFKTTNPLYPDKSNKKE